MSGDRRLVEIEQPVFFFAGHFATGIMLPFKCHSLRLRRNSASAGRSRTSLAARERMPDTHPEQRSSNQEELDEKRLRVLQLAHCVADVLAKAGRPTFVVERLDDTAIRA
jgi:hypothetical protein